MGIKWQDKIKNEEVLKRADLPSMADILIERTCDGWATSTGWNKTGSPASCCTPNSATENEIREGPDSDTKMLLKGT